MPSKSGKPEVEQTSVKRWTAKRKSSVVIDILCGRTTPAEVARQHDLTVAEIESWKRRFLAGAEEQLRANPRDARARWAAEKKDLYAKIGELSLEVDILKKTEELLGKEEEAGGWS